MQEKQEYEKAAYFYDLFDMKENIEFFYYYPSQGDQRLIVEAVKL